MLGLGLGLKLGLGLADRGSVWGLELVLGPELGLGWS